ncbi:hypothetical protein BKA65DRAFT_525413 [Rhexocercosporidium sp. MPI-PUGE-AT-0058]|nr:hypothetical protein BKA65DRAFT_525413 [Rhexocercosporidium sp. MPI-PUGE-AT-0058]
MALPLVAAWPAVMEAVQNGENLKGFQKQQTVYPTVPPPKFITDRDNSGSHGKCTLFDAKDQFVDVRTGSGHEFKSPGTNDKRGQCPGPNAAATHGFLSHNGVATTQQTIEGLGVAYGMSPELALALAAISIAISGDPIAGTWSIGGSFPSALDLLGTQTGIVGTHNRYEGDASIVRGDAYMNGGNVGVLEMHRWERLYSLATSEGGLTHDKVESQVYYTTEYSIQSNPYYFSHPFSGLVAPDGHNFVVHLMSNRSAENMGGVLNGEVLKSFFAVTGTPGNFVHNRGMERIPDNWYKRPTSQPMNTIDTNVDTIINDRIYPGVIRFGGNTGMVNSFVGVDTGDLTGGNNISCFFLQATMAGLADAAIPIFKPVSQVLDFLSKNLGPQLKGLNCPQLSNFNNKLFSKYPGASYKAQGQ